MRLPSLFPGELLRNRPYGGLRICSFPPYPFIRQSGPSPQNSELTRELAKNLPKLRTGRANRSQVGEHRFNLALLGGTLLLVPAPSRSLPKW